LTFQLSNRATKTSGHCYVYSLVFRRSARRSRAIACASCVSPDIDERGFYIDERGFDMPPTG
nr:hypothetical protein [Tolypothrix carrinoi HA7290-LM1]